jgi:hypothetical protein
VCGFRGAGQEPPGEILSVAKDLDKQKPVTLPA